MKDTIIVEGVVREVCRGDHTHVDVEIGGGTSRVIARRAGKLVQRFLWVLPGDRVVVELSPYDLTRGRIVERLDPGRARRTPLAA